MSREPTGREVLLAWVGLLGSVLLGAVFYGMLALTIYLWVFN